MLRYPFYGHILILFIIAVTCLRVFFIKHSRRDSLVLCAPLAFAICILQLLTNDITYAGIVLLYFSFIVLFINWRGIIRFCNHLLVDHYSVTFIISSTICLLAALFFAVILYLNYPVTLDTNKYQVQKETSVLYKNSAGEYTSEPEFVFKKPDLVLTVYSPDAKQNNKENDFVILFTPDKRADKNAYDPYLILLAKNGYRVYAGDFGFSTIPSSKKINLDSVRHFNLIMETSKKPDEYFKANPEFVNAYAKEYEELSKIADKKEAHLKKFFIVADGIPAESFAMIKDPARTINACVSLNSISEYKSKGFGFVEQTDPLVAKIIFGLAKDKKCFVPSYVVLKTRQSIEAIHDAE